MRVHWADGHHPCPPSFSSWVLSPDSEVLRADHGQRSGIFLGFTGSAPAACLDAMSTRQPLTVADSEGTLPRIVTTFQECPGSASFAHLPACSTALQNRFLFLQQDPTGLPRFLWFLEVSALVSMWASLAHPHLPQCLSRCQESQC